MVGGTAAAHKFNLKDPQDTNGAFRLTFVGTWTHSTTGAAPNGVNAYANSYYTPSVNGLLNSLHLSYYSRQTTSGAYAEMGGLTVGGANDCTQLIPSYSGDRYLSINSNFVTAGAAGAADSLYITSRINATNVMLSRAGVLVEDALVDSSTRTPVALYIGARNNNGTAGDFSSRECAWASIGGGLDTIEQGDLYTIVQAFNQTLGREV